ncbi:MAG: asparagine synthase C-terminal domain-containing protein, partial [Lachnospiraceae bacterium]|nr:asparagine synthase C-terminal domain-containing protein [Lachnospiraceae bacterium]
VKGPAALYALMPGAEQPLAGQISLFHGECPYKYSEYEENFLEETNHNIMLMDMLMYHPDDILVKVDRAAMANSLETRVPMLDKDVVEFAWTLPIEFKRGDGEGKQVLRNVLYRYVPKEIMDRPKKGFSIPVKKWLKEPGLRQWAEGLLNPVLIRQQGFLNEGVVSRIWDDFISKDIWRVQIWYILMFQEWLQGEESGGTRL